ncbi:MAG: DUF819 domain-containing protein [Lishizhenia sp.]
MKIISIYLSLLFSLFSFGAETFFVVEKDSLLVLDQRIPNSLIQKAKSVNYNSTSAIFDQTTYYYVNFTDNQRRAIERADSVQVVFNKDTNFVSKLADVYFKNPGAEGLINFKVVPFKKSKAQDFDENSGVNCSFLKFAPKKTIITNDKVVIGILMLLLAVIFYTSNLKGKFWKRFYTIIPALFLCYMLPAVLTSVGLISAEESGLYHMASRYLLPASLILLILSIDIGAFLRLGSKSLIMFFTGTVGVIVGGVFAIWLFGMIAPSTVGGEGSEATWRGMATIAGSWIGGGANQTAMLETYGYKETLYGGMVLVDIVVANIWMAVVLFGIGKRSKIDKWLKADTSAIDELVVKVEKMNAKFERKATLSDYIVMLGIVFAGVGIAHFLSGYLSEFFLEKLGKGNTLSSSFFWMVVLSTVYGFILSLTKAREYEGVGASKFGSIFLYVLVATIGMKVDIARIFENPSLILIGLVWIAVHAGFLVIVAKIIKAPYFFLAVGSQANIGGAASAPVVANAFHPALTTVGVLMAVFGYFIGTFGAVLCAELMHLVAPV